MPEPRRIQLRRTAGFRLRDISPNAVVVSRPSKWGNPIRVTRERNPDRNGAKWQYRVHGSPRGQFVVCDMASARRLAAWQFKCDLLNGRFTDYPTLADIRRELAGRDVACWCPPREVHRNGALGEISCHGDVLLDIAGGDWPQLGGEP